MKLKAVFLDKDGSVIPNIPHNINGSKDALNDGVVEGLQMLQSYGYLLVMVSNQAISDQRYFSEKQLNKSEKGLYDSCLKLGIYLDGFYNGPNSGKPLPELLVQAAGDKDIDLSSSWMIGDILHDVEAGNRAGCKAILINNGTETEWKPGEARMPEFFAKDLSEAAKYIITASKTNGISAEHLEKYSLNQA
jgi:D-glycero-D-manno-heptose 1,7-bisphosphate phosphatase